MEIKPQEIRIGNIVTIDNPTHWANLKGVPLIIRSIELVSERDFPNSSASIGLINEQRKTYSQFSEFIKPIELTHELLTKLGWGKSEEHEIGHNAYEPWGFYYDYHFKRFRIENSDTDWDVEMPNVKYLHQVQNLIFSLTGEELAIDKTSLKDETQR